MTKRNRAQRSARSRNTLVQAASVTWWSPHARMRTKLRVTLGGLTHVVWEDIRNFRHGMYPDNDYTRRIVFATGCNIVVAVDKMTAVASRKKPTCIACLTEKFHAPF